MVGASSRLLSLLTNPSSLLHHRPFALFRLARRPLATISAAPNHLLHHSHPNSLIPINFSQNFYSRASNYTWHEHNHVPVNDYRVPPSHPWPEWFRLLESLSAGGYFNGNSNIEDEFVANVNLPMEFVAAANSCLAYARDRPDILWQLPRNDIAVLINDGYPFLFKSAHETERRMRSILQPQGSNEATSVDLMKYILSYASNPIIYPGRNTNQTTESSVRSLLQEITNFIYRNQTSYQFQAVGRNEQMPRNLGPNITMKRGDWICPKCSFMNFARNIKCLECEESRPQRQLADGEWDCPQCNYLNYRKNTVCFKCECKRPGEAPLPGPPYEKQRINSHYQNNYENQETSINHNREQFYGNNSSVSRTYIKNIGSSSEYVPFVPLPADMFAKKPEKLTHELNEESQRSDSVRSSDSQRSENPATYVQSKQIQDTDKEDKTQTWFKKVKELHGVTEPISSDSSSTHFRTNESQPGKSNIGQWVPENMNISPNLHKDTNTDSSSTHFRINESQPEKSNVGQRVPENMNVKSGWVGKSLEGSAVTESDPLDMSEEAKAERWFRRVAQIKDISELSQIPDEDFPSIMPMRKGVNRFVVSKRKTPLERRLTSPQYRKNLRIMSSDPMKKEGNDD